MEATAVSIISALRENCPNTELFLVRIFLYSDWIRRFTPWISVFSPNTGKYGPEITPYLDFFVQCWVTTKTSEQNAEARDQLDIKNCSIVLLFLCLVQAKFRSFTSIFIVCYL